MPMLSNDWLNSPLMSMGMGLLGAAQPVPYGQTRFGQGLNVFSVMQQLAIQQQEAERQRQEAALAQQKFTTEQEQAKLRRASMENLLGATRPQQSEQAYWDRTANMPGVRTATEQVPAWSPQQRAALEASMYGADIPDPAMEQMFRQPVSERADEARTLAQAKATGTAAGTPKKFRIETITHGTETIDVVVDEQGNVVRELGRGRKFAPRQGTDFERLIADRSPEEQAVLKQKRLDKLIDDEKAEFGTGMEGQAYNAIMEYNEYLRAGQEPPPDVVAKATTAEHILGTKKFFRDPEGNLMSYTPGVPQGMQAPSMQAARAPEAQAAEGGQAHQVREEQEKLPPSFEGAYAALESVADLLNEAAVSGETITGPTGWIKNKAGGWARIAGMDVSTKAEELARQLNFLALEAAPAILQEKGRSISDLDRARLDKVLATLGPAMDEKGLRVALKDLYQILKRIEQR